MKKLTLVFSFMLAATLCPLFLSNAFSQPPAGGPGQRQRLTPEQRLERLDKQVGGLTADQKKKILAAWQEAEKNREQQPPAAGERPNARREQLNQNRQSGQGSGGRMGGFGMLGTEVEKILTPAQKKKYQDTIRQEGIDRQLDRLSDLNLTDAQKKKLSTIFEKQNENMMKSMEKMRESQDRQAMMDAFRKMREENDKEIMTVLTSDQKKKYEDMQKQMMNRRGQGGQGRGQGRGQQQ